MYSLEEQQQAESYIQRERGVALRLAGLTEDDLTDEQEIALTRYVRVSAAVHLAKYGPEGPRGSVLRMETEAETAARVEWEGTIKTPEQKRRDRVTQTIFDQAQAWCLEHHHVYVRWYEELYDKWRAEYIADGQASEQDAMYDVIACVYRSTGWSDHDLYDVRLAVAVSPDEDVNVVSTWVNLVDVECKDYEDYLAQVSEEE